MGVDNMKVFLLRGVIDVSFIFYYVDWGKLFIDECFGGYKLIEVEMIKYNMELICFLVLVDKDY